MGEEEEELDDKITKKEKRNIHENLRANLLRARTMNEKNGSMIQARITYFKKDVKNNETTNPIINIADEEKKDDEEVAKGGEEEEKNEEEEWEEVSSEVEQRKDDNEKSQKTIKERKKWKYDTSENNLFQKRCR